MCKNRYICTQNFVYMEWNKDTLKEKRIEAKISQTSLAKMLGVHWRTIQNWEKGTSILASVIPYLDKIFGDIQDVVPREASVKPYHDVESLRQTYAPKLKKGAPFFVTI